MDFIYIFLILIIDKLLLINFQHEENIAYIRLYTLLIHISFYYLALFLIYFFTNIIND